MDKERMLYSIIHAMRYNVVYGVYTYGYCSQGCSNPARGSGTCNACLETELTALLGDSMAAECIRSAIEYESQLIGDALRLIKEKEK